MPGSMNCVKIINLEKDDLNAVDKDTFTKDVHCKISDSASEG